MAHNIVHLMIYKHNAIEILYTNAIEILYTHK